MDALFDFAVVVGSAYGEALVEAGADCIVIGEALASPSMLSPAFYRRFDECRRLIEANKAHGRFILSAGCNMSPASVPDNLRAMVTAAEEFGPY